MKRIALTLIAAVSLTSLTGCIVPHRAAYRGGGVSVDYSAPYAEVQYDVYAPRSCAPRPQRVYHHRHVERSAPRAHRVEHRAPRYSQPAPRRHRGSHGSATVSW